MRRIVLIGLVLVSACHKPMYDTYVAPPPPSAYAHFSDRLAAKMVSWGIPWKWPCTRKEVINNAPMGISLPTTQCYKMGPTRRWRGLWRQERAAFCEAPASECPAKAPYDQMDFAVSLPGDLKGPLSTGLYEIDFVGRRTAYSTDGGRVAIVVVEKLNSIREMKERPLLAPEAFVRRQDQEAVRRLNAGLKAPYPCADLQRQPVDRCYRFGAQQHWKGEWRLEMESSTFCPAPSRNCPKDYQSKLWLEFQKGAEPRENKYPPGGTFAIEFDGRKNLLPGTFGYAGMFENEVIVDRVISMKKVED